VVNSSLLKHAGRRVLCSVIWFITVLFVADAAHAQVASTLIVRSTSASALLMPLSYEEGLVGLLQPRQATRGGLTMLTGKSDHPEARWRRYAIGGAVAGLVGGLALVAFLPCNENCQTGDGRAGRLAGVPVAVALGAAIGAGVGAIVDHSHGS
jgi:hypothetical protein